VEESGEAAVGDERLKGNEPHCMGLLNTKLSTSLHLRRIRFRRALLDSLSTEILQKWESYNSFCEETVIKLETGKVEDLDLIELEEKRGKWDGEKERYRSEHDTLSSSISVDFDEYDELQADAANMGEGEVKKWPIEKSEIIAAHDKFLGIPFMKTQSDRHSSLLIFHRHFAAT
jgi:hypothetical protein